MYVSGLVVGYILGLICFYLKANIEYKESRLNSLVIAIFGSLIPAILSWFGVFVLVAYIFNILKSKN